MTGRAELSSCGCTLSVFPEGEEEEVPSWIRITSNHSWGPALLLLHLLPLFQQLLFILGRGIPIFIFYFFYSWWVSPHVHLPLNNQRHEQSSSQTLCRIIITSTQLLIAMWNLQPLLGHTQEQYSSIFLWNFFFFGMPLYNRYNY